jgi:hypothetical protein
MVLVSAAEASVNKRERTPVKSKAVQVQAETGGKCRENTPFCSNRFILLSTDLLKEEREEEKREKLRVEHKPQGTLGRFIYLWFYTNP